MLCYGRGSADIMSGHMLCGLWHHKNRDQESDRCQAVAFLFVSEVKFYEKKQY